MDELTKTIERLREISAKLKKELERYNRYDPLYYEERNKIRETITEQCTEHAPNEIWLAEHKAGLRLRLHISDRKYYAIPVALWKHILKHSKVNERQYVSERADCDDFAKALAGTVSLDYHINGIGIVTDIGAGHAYNAILCNDDGKLEIKLVEPQTDQIIKPGESKSHTGQAGELRF